MNQHHIKAICKSLTRLDAVPRLYPAFGYRAAWEKTARKKSVVPYLREIISLADSILDGPIPSPRLSDALRFRLDGDRSSFERPYFLRRVHLSALTLACVLTGDKARYFPAVVDYLGAIAGERFWCVPAHAFYPDDPAEPFPLDKTREYTDLYASATAAQAALTIHLLEDELKAYSPRLTQLLRETVLDRTIRPLLEHRQEPGWFSGVGNWTTWCSQNLLTTGTALLKDPKELSKLVELLWNAVERFWDRYSQDGYCDEGAAYWTRAGSELIVFLHRLDTILPGCVQEAARQEKFVNIASFPMKMHIADNLFHVFADGIARITLVPDSLLNAARLTGRKEFCDFARETAAPPEKIFSASFNCGEMLRCLLDLLTVLPDDFSAKPAPAVKADAFFPGRLAVLRRGPLTAVLKGGNNAECHNHNDLGHFAFYADGKPVVIDLGAGKYTRQYFAPEQRYRQLTTGAHGHNAPLFDGKGEETGAQYTADLRLSGGSGAEVELAAAYPETFGIRNLTRSVELDAETLLVQDHLERTGTGRVQLTLYSPCRIEKISASELDFDSFIRVRLVNLRIAEIEKTEVRDPNLMASWGNVLWKLELETLSSDWSMRFRKI